MNGSRSRRSITTLAFTAGIALLQLAAQAQGTPPKPKVSAKQAEAAAVKKLGGKAVSSKYEFEDGHWQYAVIVQNAKGMFEAEVSSTTGKVTATEKTTPAEEAKEAAEDKKKAESKGKEQKETPEKGETKD